MNPSESADAALDALLRASAPGPLADDGFVAHTMAAVDAAARGVPVRRATPAAPIAIAHALAAEQRRHEAQARLWRWAFAGVVAGFVLLVMAVLLSPGGVTVALPTASQWFPLATLLAVGSIWLAWRELRGN